MVHAWEATAMDLFKGYGFTTARSKEQHDDARALIQLIDNATNGRFRPQGVDYQSQTQHPMTTALVSISRGW